MTSEESKKENEKEIEAPTEADLTQELSEARKKAEDYLDSWKRAQADYSNLKRRTEQEKQEMGKYANTQLILALLPVLDDLDRAFEKMPHRMAKTEWAEGFQLIASKLLTTLEAQGLKPIDAIGKPFDPARHDACLHEKGKEGVVIKDLRKGYTLFDKVIRPTQAVVGNGEIEGKETIPDNNHIQENQEQS